jgi:hypothetical protein
MWGNDWIVTARQILRDEFECSYKDFAAADLTTPNAEHDSKLKKVH